MPPVIVTDLSRAPDSHLPYRADVDGLRAVAVLAVVVFHAFPGRVHGGFVGVDIFFVISGFLISGIVFRSLQTGRFRFADFYARRARRIFPALLIVLIGTLLFGWIALLSDEYERLGKHVAGGAGFVSNWLSWNEAGYFDAAAELKPLLHLWSLGIEEQFYLIWPPLVLLAWRRGRVPVLIAMLLVIPFALNVWKVHGNAETAFYLPFTRFWELMVGGALAWISRSRAKLTGTAADVTAASGLVLIGISIVLLGREKAFPGWWALLPTAGAFLTIVAGERAWANRVLLANPIAVWFGLISYPLYLWHWPLLSFARILSADLPTWRTKLVLIASSVVLAWLTYWFVERPVRAAKRTRALPLALAGSLAVVGLGGLVVYALQGVPSRFPGFSNQVAQLQWRFLKNHACERRFRFSHERSWWSCLLSTDSPPTVLLLGSSHANHLYPGLAERRELSRQSLLSLGACDPVDRLTFRSSEPNTVSACLNGENLTGNAFIQGIVSASPSIRYALLGASWPSFGDDGALEAFADGSRWHIDETDGRDEKRSEFERYLAGLSRYVSFLEGRHISVILAFDTPLLAYDPRDCLDIRPFPKRPRKDCLIPRDAELARQRSFRRLAAQLVASHPTVKIFDPLPTFCGPAVCEMVRGGEVLMRDQNHLSVAGSRVFAESFVQWARANAPELLSSEVSAK
jgi:peptidoglycan/LPS O-acetylase OafA/YrhL